MDAKFYIKNLNNSSNEGGGSKGVEGNSERLLTINTTPNYIYILSSSDELLEDTIIAIDDVKKSPIKDNLSLGFQGLLLYKESPIPNSDLRAIQYESGFNVTNKDVGVINRKAIKFKDNLDMPQEYNEKFGDYYMIVLDDEEEGTGGK